MKYLNKNIMNNKLFKILQIIYKMFNNNKIIIIMIN